MCCSPGQNLADAACIATIERQKNATSYFTPEYAPYAVFDVDSLLRVLIRTFKVGMGNFGNVKVQVKTPDGQIDIVLEWKKNPPKLTDLFGVAKTSLRPSCL